MRIRAMGESYIAKLQDALRLGGYPNDVSGEVQELQLTLAGPRLSTAQHWEFADRTRSWSIRITESFLALQTTAYSTFEEFVERLSNACDLLAGTVDGIVIERVGLRYIDAIRPAAAESFRDYVVEGLHGLVHGHPMLETTMSERHEISGQTGFGHMIVRLSQLRGQLLPDDLVSQLRPPEAFRDLLSDELITLLDLDHFRAEQVDYQKGIVSEWGWKLHDDLDKVFRSTVTSHALEQWHEELRD